MNRRNLLRASFASALLIVPTHGATLAQTFEDGEDGEDTSAWGSAWNDGVVVSTFLDPSFGGQRAGSGSSASQTFWRSFRDNTAGLDVASPYTISAFVQVNLFDGPAGGLFEIIDGSFGSANAANLGIRTETTGPGTFVFQWQAKNAGVWQDLGITLDLGAAYQFELSVDPLSFLYSAEVMRVDLDGAVIDSAGSAGLGFDSNVITNGQNGELRFYIEASAGGTGVIVDNINIQGVPEPSALLLAATAALAGFHRRRRPAG